MGTTRVVKVHVHVVATPLDDALGSNAVLQTSQAAIDSAACLLRVELEKMLKANDACTVIVGSSVDDESED